jgi:hypothetical protein
MKKKVLMSLVVVSLLGISGCGKEEGKNTKNSETKVTTSSTTKEEKSESSTSVKTSSSTEESNSDNWSEAQALLQENTEAEQMTTIFENNDAIINGDDQVSVTINGYQYIELGNISREFRIPFGDQVKEGAVLLVSATYENKSEQSVYTGPGFSMTVTGFDSSIGRVKKLLGDDLVSDLTSVENEIKSGEKVTGYVGLAIQPEAMEKIKEYGTAMFELPGIYSKADSFSKADALVESKEVTIGLSSEGEDSKQEASKFYEDKATLDNMGTKTMLVEKQMDKTEKFEDISVTVAGYQVVSFDPNEDQVARFSNFETGVVLLTVKVIINNGNQEVLNIDRTSATLTIGNSIKTTSENMLEVDSGLDHVEKGQEGEKYIVFTMDKESYEKLYKDQDFLLDVSLYDTDFKRLTTLGDLSFELSND